MLEDKSKGQALLSYYSGYVASFLRNLPLDKPAVHPDEVDPAISPLDLELQAVDHPMPELNRLVDIDGAVGLRPARRETELGALGDRDAAHGKAGRDRRAELADRDRIGVELGDRRPIRLGVPEEPHGQEEAQRDRCEEPAQDHDAGDRPVALHPLEVRDVSPPLVAPRPLAALRAEHERHHDVNEWDHRQQRDIGVVADAPDPVEQERAPVPASDLGRNECALALA